MMTLFCLIYQCIVSFNSTQKNKCLDKSFVTNNTVCHQHKPYFSLHWSTGIRFPLFYSFTKNRDFSTKLSLAVIFTRKKGGGGTIKTVKIQCFLFLNIIIYYLLVIISTVVIESVQTRSTSIDPHQY